MNDEIPAGISQLRQALDILSGLAPSTANALPSLIAFSILLAVSLLVWLLFNHAIRPLLLVIVRKTKTRWDDAFAESKALQRAMLLPAIMVFYGGIKGIEIFEPPWEGAIERLTLAALIVLIARMVSAGFAAIDIIYSEYELSKERPIKGFIQVAQIATYFITGIIVVAIIINRSPVALFTGLSAMTAVLMLIFQNTILSLVAGVQLTAANHIQVGDWIEMPDFGADGFVIDLALNTVSVENWDKTVSIIPTHNFLNHSFKNWRNIFDLNARRIKTQLYIDLTSIRRLTEEELEALAEIDLIKPYLNERSAEIEKHNQQLIDDGVLPNSVNLRGHTNIGLFRAYVDAYICSNPELIPNTSALNFVRALQSTEYGIPLEVYAFSANPSFVEYERIKQDIFDHLLTTLPVFHLRVYQAPSGHDLKKMHLTTSAPEASDERAS